ncbi:hypothetical protein Hanom_Chr01g00029991 [Helianthus anomalus]
MLTVVAEARVQHASIKNRFHLSTETRVSPRVQQRKQSVLPEMATRPRLHRIKLYC